MTDIDDSHRRTLTHFGAYQMQLNPAGIGNECTHWIYAALFEARALDSDKAMHISQKKPPYTWGHRAQSIDVQRGDIAQFHGFQSHFFIYQETSSRRWFLSSDQVRGPNHTGMVFIVPDGGTYYQLESHLHHTGIPRMQIRGNTIYYDSFSIALSASELQQLQGPAAWPADVKTVDIEDMLERVDWRSMRVEHSLDMVTAQRLELQAKRGAAVQVLGDKIACLFIVRSIGSLQFFSPQASAARLGMDDAKLAMEKADLIHSMIVSGRRGGPATEDKFGGDNKTERLHDRRFDWTYDPTWVPSS